MSDEEKKGRNPAEKAAAVISIIGAEAASEVFRYLNDNEIEQISIELARLPKLDDRDIQEISKEFYDCCVTQKIISEGGKDYAKEVLEMCIRDRYMPVLPKKELRWGMMSLTGPY